MTDGPRAAVLGRASRGSRAGSGWLSAIWRRGPVTNSAPVASGNYVYGLDGLRAVSILLVFLGHYGALSAGGMFGVQVFFVISGFIITRVLAAEFEKKSTIDIRRFYLRRFLRLGPVLYASIAVVVIASVLIGIRLDLPALAAAALYYSNYFQAQTHIQPYSMPLWSLAIEEHFYLVFPLVILLLFRKRADCVLWLAAACALVLVIRLGYFIADPADPGQTYLRTECRVDAILFGAILSFLVSRRAGGGGGGERGSITWRSASACSCSVCPTWSGRRRFAKSSCIPCRA